MLIRVEENVSKDSTEDVKQKDREKVVNFLIIIHNNNDVICGKCGCIDILIMIPDIIIKTLYKITNFQDDQYWGQREKTKSAALRSHEERRLLKQNQIALRLAHLERENGKIKQVLNSAQFDLTQLTNERNLLKRKLAHFE